MISAQLKAALLETIHSLGATEVQSVDINPAPESQFGDLSSPVALSLSKVLGKAPLEIAKDIKSNLNLPSFVREVSVSAPGFVNFHLDHGVIFQALISADTVRPASGIRISVEHTSVNPNKSAHIGHLRNACLGDTLANILRTQGHEIDVQNYIDDTGPQVADLIVAERLFGTSYEKDGNGHKCDDFYWDLYTRIQGAYAEDESLAEKRSEVLKNIEHGNDPDAERSLVLARMIAGRHLETFEDFGIRYDRLIWERDIIASGLWPQTFELLKSKPGIAKRESGIYDGAWVVEFGEEENQDKVLVRSSGVATYVAKDIAYALWKLGKGPVAMPFGETKDYPYPLLTTPAGSAEKLDTTLLQGNADKTITVIDVGQTYTQNVLKQALTLIGQGQDAYHHLAYEKVRLSAKSMRQLGLEAEVGSHSMSGRKGIGVKVADLLEKMTELIQHDHADTTPDAARKIAVGAIRYYMLKFRPHTEIIFDFDEAMQTTGNTGVYVQYAYTRAVNILDKTTAPNKPVSPAEMSAEERSLLLALSSYKEKLEESERTLDPSLMADYAYSLAEAFAKFYETSPVLKAEGETQEFRLALTSLFVNIYKQCLELLGIPQLERM